MNNETNKIYLSNYVIWRFVTKTNQFQIHNSQSKGRFLIATRDVQAGEIVLKEHPILVTPGDPLSSCLACNKSIEKSEQK